MLSFFTGSRGSNGPALPSPFGRKFQFRKQSLSEFKSCEHTHFDHLLSSATLLHFMTMEHITSNKGGRKLAFENNISIKQKVLSNGTVWGDIMGGFCPGGFCLGDFVWGDFLLGGILSRGILSRGILSGGFCPGEFCPGGFCPRNSKCKG